MDGVKTDIGGLKTDMDGVKTDIGGLKTDMDGVKTDIGGLKTDMDEMKIETRKTNLFIENELSPKIDALLDGYKQNADRLDRIERKVDQHEEFIIRRIK